MSRQSRARRARLWTMAGLTFLSGCGGAASDKPSASATIGGNAPAASVESKQTSFAPRYTLDGAIVPVWYPFDDPPMPALLPADGAAVDVPAEAEKPYKGPTVVLPPAGSSSFQRLPPVSPENTPEPDGDRYDIDSRYSLDGPSHEPPQDGGAETHDVQSLDAAEARTAPATLEPAVEAPRQESAPRPRGTFQRLPPVEYAPPHTPIHAPAESAPSNEPAPSYEPAPSIAPDVSAASRSSEPFPVVRPSDVFADEARPVERREYNPSADTAAASRVQRIAPPIAVSPTYEPTYAAPQVVERSEPIVLPPMDTRIGDESQFAAVHPPRHREMQLINDRAAEGVSAGFALAHRGALYSAQSEFAAALRVVAQALDAQENGTQHVESLAAGLTALEEADDFLVPTRSATAPIDVASIVAKHRTPVLKDAPKPDLTPITALQGYYTFAQEQLAAAVEHEPAASQALYGLGKVQTTLQTSRTGTVADGPKAIALHQAALLVDDRNFMAANELGVLMARCGRFDMARAALAHSVSISPQPAVWRNLAAVHDRLGETSLAANARAAAENYARGAPRPSATSPSATPNMPQQPVVWLDPAAFAQSAQPQSDLQRGQPTASANGGPNAVAPSSVPHTSDKKSSFKWPLW